MLSNDTRDFAIAAIDRRLGVYSQQLADLRSRITDLTALRDEIAAEVARESPAASASDLAAFSARQSAPSVPRAGRSPLAKDPDDHSGDKAHAARLKVVDFLMEKGNANCPEVAAFLKVSDFVARGLLDHPWFVKTGNGRGTTYRNAPSRE